MRSLRLAVLVSAFLMGIGNIALGVGSWPQLNSARLGLSIQYPPGWSVLDSSATYVRISNVPQPAEVSQDSLANESFFELSLLGARGQADQKANPKQLAIASWFDAYFAQGFSGPPLSRANVLIGGQPSVCIEASEIGRWKHCYVALGEDVLEIAYGVHAPRFVAAYERMLKSLRFTR